MADYKKMYTTLFNAVTDALGLMEDEKFVDAAVVLATAQLQTEEMYIVILKMRFSSYFLVIWQVF